MGSLFALSVFSPSVVIMASYAPLPFHICLLASPGDHLDDDVFGTLPSEFLSNETALRVHILEVQAALACLREGELSQFVEHVCRVWLLACQGCFAFASPSWLLGHSFWLWPDNLPKVYLFVSWYFLGTLPSEDASNMVAKF